MSTKEKLISHVMKEEPVGCRNKVTVVGVGMVGMASAISVLLKVRGAKLGDKEGVEGGGGGGPERGEDGYWDSLADK